MSTKMDKVESSKTIVSFLKKIAEQDNRATAAPYFYVIRTKDKFPVGRDNCDDPEDSYQTEEYDLFEYYNEDFDRLDREEYLELDKNDRQVVFYKETWVEKGIFLTETDAKRHLEANYYHYSDDAHTYVKHAWRAPELKQFFQALYNFFDLEKGNLDL